MPSRATLASWPPPAHLHYPSPRGPRSGPATRLVAAPARRCRAARTPRGSRRPTGATRSRCWRSRRRRACPSSCRSATGGCSPRRSRSSAARAYLMAADLAATPGTGLSVQLCGDAHLSNFGAYAAPDRQLVFDVNDFDETLPGPLEWDVKRLARASPSPAATAASTRGERARRQRRRARAYREAMRDFAAMRDARRVVRARSRSRRCSRAGRRRRPRRAQDASRRTSPRRARKDSLRAFEKLTDDVDGEPRIVSDPPLDRADRGPGRGRASTRAASEVRPARWSAPTARTPGQRPPAAARALPPVDVARKVVGVGSVGTRAWIVLLLGRDDERPAVPAVQGGAALGARAVPRREPVRDPRPARRRGPAPDAGGERHPARLAARRPAPTASTATSTCASCGTRRAPCESRRMTAAGLRALRRDLRLDARPRPRPLGRPRSRSPPISAAATASTARWPTFAEAYADQNERDYAAMAAAVEAGRIEAQTGV